MVVRVAGIALALVCAGAARNNESNTPPETRGENESVVITATLYAKPEAVKEVLGSDLGGHYIVLAIEVTPRFGKEVAINRDDFVLKTDKDGEKSAPFAPSQIAGRGAMVVRQTGGAGATGMHDNDPSWAAFRVRWGNHAGWVEMEWAAPARPPPPRPKRAPDPAKKTIPCWPC